MGNDSDSSCCLHKLEGTCALTMNITMKLLKLFFKVDFFLSFFQHSSSKIASYVKHMNEQYS